MDMMEQDSQMPGLAPMDTTPIPQSRAVEIVPTFVPTLSTARQDPLHNSLHSPVSGLPFLPVQSESEILNNGFANTLHLPMSESLMPFSNTAMEDVEPQLHSTTAGFIPDMTSVVDPFILVASEEEVGYSPDAHKLSLSPQSQVPSPSLHGAASSYFTGVSSSLESALDPVASTTGRSRANTSISPSSHSPFSMSPSGLQNTTSIDLSPPTSNNNTLEVSVSQQHPQTVIGQMLKDIAITAIDAGDAFENQEGAKRTTKVGELRDRIVQVLDMLAVMSLSENGLAISLPSIVSPILTIPSEQPMGLAQPAVRSMESLGSERIQQVSDQSRKRCASELEEHRNVKAMKREPQDDKPLSFPTNEVNHLPAAATTFPVPPVASSVVFPVMQPPISTIKQQAPLTATFPTFIAGSTCGPLTPLTNPINVIPAIFPPLRSSWSDPVTTTCHQHSLSAGSITGPLVNQPPLPTTHLNTVSPTIPLLTLPQSTTVPIKPTTSVKGSPIGRMSRSGSINGTTLKNPYASFAYQDGQHPDSSTWHPKMSSSSNHSGQSTWYVGSEPLNTFRRSSSDFTGLIPVTSHDSPPSDDDDDDEDDSDDSNAKTVIHRTSSTTTDVPPEYRADVDKIFFEFLNRLCSNLDATDAKGEQIHQTLMAKKMQRLDESPDFRPFKFRIQAFTNSFLDELARQGYPEEKIPTKKVRNYLWRQQYILRFNEDGKKAKSKGNHIWIVEAKKAGDGQWEFRPFHRKLASTPPSVAYCGMRWCWKPRVWDPQFSFKKIAVSFSSPSLPSWLTWKEGELCGTPPNNAENCQITAIAKFVLDNQDAQLSHAFNISIAPAPVLDSVAYSNSHRSSAACEQPPRRSTSDSALSQAPQRANVARSNRIDDTRVIRVLQSVAQRVTDEAETQFVSTLPPKQGELQALVKQKHVLEQTVEAYDKAISGQGHSQSRRLAVAAQHVVLQAARTVLADRTVASNGVTAPQAEAVGIQSVSVSELTDTTQGAIAMAVKMNGTTSNEVDIIVAATSILKARTSTHETSCVISPPTLIQASNTVPSSRIATTFPPSPLSTLPEYV